MNQQSSKRRRPEGLLSRQYIADQQTMPQPVHFPVQPGTTLPKNGAPETPFSLIDTSVVPISAPISAPTLSKQKRFVCILAIFLLIGLVGAICFVWQNAGVAPTPSVAGTTSAGQQTFSATSSSPVTNSDGMKVYIVGAVKNPGLYALPSGARVYDLVQAAGGPLPKANLVAINLAAKLNDGQEVYITLIGETPPTYAGGVPGTVGGSANAQFININTASVDEFTQRLHISKKSAQAIIDYRTQHGNFSSVDQLAQVVSSAMYNKIKAQCTV